jgi:hypothetical protein
MTSQALNLNFRFQTLSLWAGSIYIRDLKFIELRKY